MNRYDGGRMIDRAPFILILSCFSFVIISYFPLSLSSSLFLLFSVPLLPFPLSLSPFLPSLFATSPLQVWLLIICGIFFHVYRTIQHGVEHHAAATDGGTAAAMRVAASDAILEAFRIEKGRRADAS